MATAIHFDFVNISKHVRTKLMHQDSAFVEPIERTIFALAFSLNHVLSSKFTSLKLHKNETFFESSFFFLFYLHFNLTSCTFRQ